MAVPNFSLTLIPTTTVAAAGTTTGAVFQADNIKGLAVQAKFLYGAGGTAVKVYVQTSLDDGATWIDVMSITFTTSAATKVSAVHRDTALAASYTPTAGALSDDTIKNGLLGDRLRAIAVSTGTYTGATSIQVMAVAQR